MVGFEGAREREEKDWKSGKAKYSRKVKGVRGKEARKRINSCLNENN